MFEPSDPARRLVAAACLAVAAVLAPALTLATVSTDPVRDTAAGARPDGGYQIRCWQHGRLLFEENRVSLPAEGTRQALKISATDRDGRPIYIAGTDNATCLIRAAGEVSPSSPPDAPPGR
ncbi:MAG: hypothetical protein HYZ20_01855 [Burkholderiales bacterium]|nr:hypothetical protein [Burkholderiales bacterium]